MTLSSEELQIIEYLKSWNGKHITMIEIARNAAGRQKFRDTPKWANGLMYRLVEAKLVHVNERGHYSAITEDPDSAPAPSPALRRSKTAVIVGDDYFPANTTSTGAEPAPEPAPAASAEPPRWVSPQIAAILKHGKKTAVQKK